MTGVQTCALPIFIASQFGGAQNWPLGSAMAVLMILAVLLSLVVGAVIVWVVPRVAGLFSPLVERARRRVYEHALAEGFEGAKASRINIEPFRILLAAWTALVLIFLFVPIILVFVHSFNRGQSFTIWSGHTSLKWWDELFNGGVAWQVLVRPSTTLSKARRAVYPASLNTHLVVSLSQKLQTFLLVATRRMAVLISTLVKQRSQL